MQSQPLHLVVDPTFDQHSFTQILTPTKSRLLPLEAQPAICDMSSRGSSSGKYKSTLAGRVRFEKSSSQYHKVPVLRADTIMCSWAQESESYERSQSLLPLVFPWRDVLFSPSHSIPQFWTFIYMNHLCDQLQTTFDASAISPATILLMTLDTAQDPSDWECQPEGSQPICAVHPKCPVIVKQPTAVFSWACWDFVLDTCSMFLLFSHNFLWVLGMKYNSLVQRKVGPILHCMLLFEVL